MMTPERWRQIEELLDVALELPAHERSAFLDARCAGDERLRADVERILEAGERPTPLPASPVSFIAPLLVGLPGESAGSTREEARTRIGAYRVERELGRGGMGAVYLASRDDDQYRKQVAIKLLRSGGAGADLTRRFRHERQILAQLEHPGIARLLDGGVDGASPYIVMEYVEGLPLDRYCAQRGSSISQRLRLFAEVCGAVEYAHRNLVVHRDLKPANILVTPDGRVKLLDFGIAKLLDETVAEPLTRTGVLAMTPEYASPEQVRGGAITTATDVYSLGVILYELLVGRRPYELTGRTASEIERVVCETEPERPSTAVGHAASLPDDGGMAPGGARARLRLRRALRGDLDTIVMTALQKDPSRRYTGAAALLDDLRRYEQGKPLRAKPDTIAYRARKFVLRHRASVAAALLVLLLLGGFGLRESQLRREAEVAAARANAVRDYLAGVFLVSDPYGNRVEDAAQVSARTLLDRGVERIDAELSGEPAAQAEMLAILGGVYASLGILDRAEALLGRALEQRTALYGARSSEVAEALHALADVYLQQGRHEEAEAVARRSLDLRHALYGRRHVTTAEGLDRLATVYQERSAYTEALPYFREALEIRERVFGPEHLDVASSLNNLALLKLWMAEYEEAERLYRRALGIRSTQLGPEHPLTAVVAQNLAQVLHYRSEYPESERLYRESLLVKRRVLGDAHRSVTVHISNLGALLRDMGRLDEAEAHIREALALDRQIFGDAHPYVAANLLQLGATLRDAGSFDESERVFRSALEMARQLFGDEHARVAQGLEGLAATQYRKGDAVAATDAFTAAHDMALRIFGAEHPRTVANEVGLARSLHAAGRAEAAEARLRLLLARFPADHAVLHDQLAAAAVVLGRIVVERGVLDEAIAILEPAVVGIRAAHGEADWRMGEAQLALGRALAARGDRAGAEPLLIGAFTTLSASPVRLPLLIQQSRTALAELYVTWEKPDLARRYELAATP